MVPVLRERMRVLDTPGFWERRVRWVRVASSSVAAAAVYDRGAVREAGWNGMVRYSKWEGGQERLTEEAIALEIGVKELLWYIMLLKVK
jgi:hypothetical protein